MKKTAIILLCAALGLASGCGSQDNGDAEQALENVAEETTAEETFPDRFLLVWKVWKGLTRTPGRSMRRALPL